SPTRGPSGQGHRGSERPVVESALVETANPFQAVGREPALAEARAHSRGQLSQALDHRLERLHPPLALDRFLEEQRRLPGDERARNPAPPQPPEAPPLHLTPLTH